MLALLRREVVQKRQWISDDELSVAVCMGQMLPGPFVPNYVEYIAYRLHRLKGAILGVAVFLAPSVLVVLAISFFYCRYRSVPGIDQVMRGIGPVVTAILLGTCFDMGRRMIKDIKALIIFVIAFVCLTLKFDILFTVLLAGFLGIVFYRLTLPTLKAISLPLLIELFAIFAKIGLVSFGGGYAAIPLIKSELVDLRHWLDMRSFVDGVAIAQLTPGPVAIISTFVGFKTQGVVGALVATLGMFLPSFLLLLGLLQVYERISGHPLVDSFLKGIKPAVIGFLLSAAAFFALTTCADWRFALFGLAMLVITVKSKIDPVFLIAAGAVFGLAAGRLW